MIIIQNADWKKLNRQEKYKCEQMAANNWDEMEVELSPGMERDSYVFGKLNYGSILIKFKMKGNQYQTKISRQCGHRGIYE